MIYNFMSVFSLKKPKPVNEEWSEFLDDELEEQPEIVKENLFKNIIEKSVSIELKEIKIEKTIDIEKIIEVENTIDSKNSFYNFLEKIFSKDEDDKNENMILNFLDLF